MLMRNRITSNNASRLLGAVCVGGTLAFALSRKSVFADGEQKAVLTYAPNVPPVIERNFPVFNIFVEKHFFFFI